MTEPIETSFEQTRKEFLSFLKYTKGHADTTCYNYNSDLGIWYRWLAEAKLDWQTAARPTSSILFRIYPAKG